jgi:regulator of protease activity HflC (stomatin/prohibitin superfamily)
MGELFANGGIELFLSMFAGGASILLGFFKSITFVQEGERGIRLRFGKAVRRKGKEPKVIMPGFVLMIPLADKLARTHVRAQSVTVDDEVIISSEGLALLMGAFVLFKIDDVYKSLFEIDQLNTTLKDLTQSILRDLTGKKEWKNLLDTKALGEELSRELKERTKEWGVNIMEAGIRTVAPTSESAPIMNMGARVGEMKKIVEDHGLEMTPEVAIVLMGAPLVSTAPGGGETMFNGSKKR